MKGVKMYKKPVVITGTVGEDAHVIGTKILSMALREAGFEVIELGCMTPPEEFIKAALDHKADAILMSSLYGMAELDVKDFRKRCDEAGLGDIILYIGGVLAVGKQDFEIIEEKFKGFGFDRVYPPETEPEKAIEDLWYDLEARGKSKRNFGEREVKGEGRG
ncbi:MAG: methylaspartate mutase subunit S [Candidatus Bathyarchaeia archaeon]